MKSKPVSVNVTANGLAANQAQQTANQAVTSANKYKMAWEEANSEVIEALNIAQKEFESNLAWAKSQIYEGQHQNDSAVASLRSDMESSWNSMSTVEESLYNSASTATSEVDSHLESLRTQNSLSLADLRNAADSLHAVANSLNSNMDSVRGSLAAATSELGQDITSTRNSLDGTRNSLANQAGSLATATSELQRQTGQLSGSLSTANSMIMFNSNAISEVKHTAEEISTTVSNLRVGDRNLARGVASSKDWFDFGGFNNLTNYCYNLVDYSLDTLKAGDIVTFGITVKNDGVTSGTMIFMQSGNVSGWNRDFSSIGPTGNNVTDFVPNGVEKALTYTITVTDGMLNQNSSYTIDIRTDNVPAGGKLSFRYAFVKKGTMATDWTPAPEDTDSAISTVSQTADAIKADLANTKGDVASLKTTASSLTSDIADAKGNISALQQTASGLQSTVADQSGKISQLQQDADGLSATVGGAAIDIIPNLDQQFVMGYGIDNTVWQDGNSYIQLPTTKKSGEVLPQTAGFTLNIPWQAGKTYMQSIIFETDATIDDSVQPQWTWYTPTANGHDFQNATLSKLGNNTYRLIGSYTPTQAKVNSGNLRIFDIYNFADFVDVTTGTYLKFRNPRIWCPDDNSLAQLKLTADGLTSKVADTQGNVSKLQLTASTLQTQVADNQNNISSVKITADTVQTDLTNAKNDIARVKVTADSLTSSMTNAQNQIGVLQHRADSLTSTLSNGGVNLLNNSQGNFQPNNSAIDNWQRFDGVNVYMTQGQKYTVSAQSAPGFAFDSTHDTTTESNRILLWLVDNGINQIISSNTTDISQGGTHFTWNYASGTYTLRVNSYKKDNSGYAYHVQIEYGDTATSWKPSNGDISLLQQTASQLTVDMKDAKGNISSLQDTASQFSTRLQDAEGNVSSLQETSKELDTQIKAVDGRATTIKETADGISARVSKIEGSNIVGSLLKLDGSEAGLGTYVNNKLIAGINTNPDGVTIDGKNIHLNGQTHIDDGVINASKITVYNTVGDNKGDQYLAVAWGQLNSTIGGKDDQGNTLWGSINQTNSKLTSYYQELKNDGSSTRSLIQQKSDQILLAVDQKVQYKTYGVSASTPWDFNDTKSIYENWFVNGDTSGNYFYNGPDGLKPWVYVQSRGSADGTRFVVTVWRDYDPTQYQRTWTGDHWTPWVMLPNSSNLVSAINLSPDGVTIDGKNIELNGNTTIHGQLNLLPTDQREVDQNVQGFHNPWHWRDSNVFAGSGGLQLQSTVISQKYSDDNTTIGGLVGGSSAAITTLAPTYLKFTVYPSWNDVANNFSNQLCRTYIDAGRIETTDVRTDNLEVGGFKLNGSKMYGLNGSLYVTNWHGTNFDNGGAAGFQVWNGIGLGQGTIYTPSNNLYIQQGNVGPAFGQSYSSAGKVTVHCDHVASQSANTVTSRLSTKTAITKVDYDRALMAVQNTDMYDYRYIEDDSNQHYVSGIIDDIHDKPEYNLDPMLINQERTARIDANLLGYHHVVLQEILKRLDKLEAK